MPTVVSESVRVRSEYAEPQEPEVSIVVPLHDEEESVELLFRQITEALVGWHHSYELLFVNDGSQDATAPIIDRLAEQDPRVIAVHLRRNFGQTAALMAGIDLARGEVIVTMDGDLQNDPADIPVLVERLKDGFDVVSGWRKNRQDQGLTRILPSKCANWLARLLSGVRLHDIGCTLKAYRKESLHGVRLYGEMHRFIPIHVHIQGGAITEVVVNHRARQYGRSKYGLGRIHKVFLDLLLLRFLASFASRPSHVFGGFGLICLAASLLPAALAFFFKFTTVPGWQKDFVETPLPVVTAVMVLVGFLSIQQGLVAELLTRTYFESQNKRTYTVSRITRS